MVSCCGGHREEQPEWTRSIIVTNTEVKQQKERRGLSGMHILHSGPVSTKNMWQDGVHTHLKSSPEARPDLDSARMTKLPSIGENELGTDALLHAAESTGAKGSSRGPMRCISGAANSRVLSYSAFDDDAISATSAGCRASASTIQSGTVDQEHLEHLRLRYLQVQQRLHSRS